MQYLASDSAMVTPLEMIRYGMSKTALLAGSRGYAKEATGTGVTVDAVVAGRPTLPGSRTPCDEVQSVRRGSIGRMTKSASDLTRTIAVAATAVTQVISSPVTTALLGPSSSNAVISDGNLSPVTPAGYAFAIWGLIYLGSLALAGYQLLPTQRSREVHRRTGWWIAGAFSASTVWIPIFGSRTIWLSQVVILLLVVCLAVVTWRLTRLGAADNTTERLLLRLPVALYLGWATLATFAGLGTTLRSLGMPERAGWVTVLSVALVLLAAAICTAVVSRETAVAGFAFTACWALAAIAVATYETPVRVVSLLALASVLAGLVVHTVRSRRGRVVLFG